MLRFCPLPSTLAWEFFSKRTRLLSERLIMAEPLSVLMVSPGANGSEDSAVKLTGLPLISREPFPPTVPTGDSARALSRKADEIRQPSKHGIFFRIWRPPFLVESRLVVDW